MKRIMTTKGRETKMMKMFTVVRNFLETYLKYTRTGRFYRPKFADNILEIWYGLSEQERQLILNFARRDDLVSLEKLLIKIDDEDQAKEAETELT